MPLLRFPPKGGKAFMRHYASSSEKSLVCLRCSVVNALATLRLHYQLFSVKRSSLRSERCRSELLFVKKEKLRASFLCFTFHKRLRRASERANILRVSAESGSAFKVRRSDSSEKSLVVAPVKITIAFARLFLLRSTTNFFR